MISAATPSATAPDRESGDHEDEALALDRDQVALGDHPLVAVEDHAVSLASADSIESSSRSPVAAVLELDHALRQAARADDQLPGQADQVHRAELDPAPLVAVVVEHLDAGRRQLGVNLVGAAIEAASSPRMVTSPTFHGATASGQMMPLSSWLASMIAPTSRDTPTP